MDYDVLILGGGIIGCAVAYELSKYNINIALIEKDYDVADDISFANTEVIYDGSETSDEVMASLEKQGMKMIKEHCKKFNLPYRRVGALRISSSKSENERLNLMFDKAKKREIEGVHIIEDKGIYDIEPNLNVSVDKALYSENIAVISPYNLAISYAEVAADNGVNFRLEEEVLDIKNISKGFRVTTNKNKFTCKFVVNTIPNEIFHDKNEFKVSDSDIKRMHYIIFNKKIENNLDSVIINDLNEDAFVINIPTDSKNCLIGIKGYESLSLETAVELSKTIIDSLNIDDISNVFKEEYIKESMLIDETKIDEGYIKVIAGNYGRVTIAPAVAVKIERILKHNMNITKKSDYIDKKRDVYVFRNMSKEKRNEIIKLDSRYGRIVCSCNNITEGEIVDSIRRPLGARTVEGVKRRTGVGQGNCNGSYCNMKIIKILARELNKSPLNIVDDSMDSKVLVSRIKEFNQI